ncbi:MAG TPA: hypothetical protein VK571_08725 [Gemmatimonadaceae bacterium]|nr:hypothetical protein [Gemmatimonadaceae bacterium]
MTLMDLAYLAHPEGDKCYQVTNEYRECSVFVWARFHAEARRRGASVLDGEWDDVDCERFPELDRFEGDLLTHLLDRGWAFDCSECAQRVGLPEAYRDGSDIFCSKEHAVKYRAHWAAVHALEKRFLDYARAKYPEENPSRAHVNVEGDGIVSTDRGCRIISRVDVDAASL